MVGSDTWLSAGIATMLAFWGTWALRRYALCSSLLDHPNERSSHATPTPRGGGVAIVVVFLGWMVIAHVLQMISPCLFWGVGGSGVLIAITGFIDDHGHIKPLWRLVLHFLAALWGIYWIIGGMQPEVFGIRITHPFLVWLLCALYLVWLLNLYNFMDGIDGIACIEAMTVASSMALLVSVSGVLPYGEMVMAPLLILTASVLGFMLWNFPSAKIFMGDAGSGFLGLILGLQSLYFASLEWTLFWVWLILLGVFVVDATMTLFRRVSTGQDFYSAHRTHAYQYASRRLGSHIPVTLIVGCINIFWLLPVAYVVASKDFPGEWGVVLAYLPLIVIAWSLNAGVPEASSVEKTEHVLK
jgi:Fuc2NAc and GlcNAc transferase